LRHSVDLVANEATCTCACRLMEMVQLILSTRNLNNGLVTGYLSLALVGQLQHMKIYLTKRERKKEITG